jgi:hypothetical protein
MTNVWLSCKELKAKYPVGSKIKINWPGSMFNGCTGNISGYEFYGKNKSYMLDLEATIWSPLGKHVFMLPFNNVILL